MTAGAVEDDPREDEHHRQDAEQVRDVLLRSEPGLMVVGGGRQVDDDVAHEGQRHERQTDARQRGEPSDLAPDGAPDLYH